MTGEQAYGRQRESERTDEDDEDTAAEDRYEQQQAQQRAPQQPAQQGTYGNQQENQSQQATQPSPTHQDNNTGIYYIIDGTGVRRDLAYSAQYQRFYYYDSQNQIHYI